MQAYMCKECSGTGEVEFTKERGGPKCNNCGGTGYLTKETLRRTMGAILDGNSVYMSGPSRHSLRQADRILDCLKEWGVEFPDEPTREGPQ